MPTNMTDSCRLPEFSTDQAAKIVVDLFALDGSLKQLDGERDLNYLLDTPQGKFVFKIANADEAPSMLESHHEVFQLIRAADAFPETATAEPSINGKTIEIISSHQGTHACRVLPFIEGRMLSEFENLQPALLENLGRCLGRLDQVLSHYAHPALDRPLLWDLREALPVLEAYKPLLATEQQREIVEYYESGFRHRVEPYRDELRRQVVHNDANRGNVVIDESGSTVLSVIDFGDMIDTWLVAEPAIAACYAMLGKATPLDNAAYLIGGFHSEYPLTDLEIDLLFDLIAMRLCMSVCICAHQIRLQPDNRYLAVDEADAWDLLSRMRNWDLAETRNRLREACR